MRLLYLASNASVAIISLASTILAAPSPQAQSSASCPPPQNADQWLSVAGDDPNDMDQYRYFPNWIDGKLPTRQIVGALHQINQAIYIVSRGRLSDPIPTPPMAFWEYPAFAYFNISQIPGSGGDSRINLRWTNAQRAVEVMRNWASTSPHRGWEGEGDIEVDVNFNWCPIGRAFLIGQDPDPPVGAGGESNGGAAEEEDEGLGGVRVS